MTESPPLADQRKTPSAAESLSRDQRQAPGTPRWVKVFLIVAIVVVLVFVIVHLAGGGMGNHLP